MIFYVLNFFTVLSSNIATFTLAVYILCLSIYKSESTPSPRVLPRQIQWLIDWRVFYNFLQCIYLHIHISNILYFHLPFCLFLSLDMHTFSLSIILSLQMHTYTHSHIHAYIYTRNLHRPKFPGTNER